jgi:outer membrane protein
MRLTLGTAAIAIISIGLHAPASNAQYQPPEGRFSFTQYEPNEVLSQKPLEGSHELSLADAIALGLRFNLDVQIERFSPLIAEQEAEAAWGAYDPMFDAELGYERNEFPNTFALETTTTQIDRDLEGSGSLQWLTPYIGATLGLVVSGSQETTNSSIQSLSPQFNSSIAFNARIPLLRGLIWNEAWTNVKVSKLGFGITRADFSKNIMNVVRDIKTLYWEVIAATEQVRVAQTSLDTANALLRQSRTQYDVGVVSKVDVVQAEAGVASRDYDLIVAVNRNENSHDDLVNAVLGPYLTATSSLTFIPTTNPSDYKTFTAGDVKEAVATAFKRRPELKAAKDRIDQREIELKYAKNQWLPRFDIEGTYGYLGIDGRDNEKCRFPSATNPNGVPCNLPPDIPHGNFGDTYDDYFSDSGSLNYSVRGIVSVPLGNITARKRLTQADLQLRRSKTEERRLEQKIILDIREAVRTLNASYRGIGAAERSSAAAQEQLRAERIRLEHGESTPFEVLLREADLVQAESKSITAIQVYRNSVTALERQQGTILETNNIHLDEVAPLR